MKLNKFLSFAVASLSVLAVSCTKDVTPTGDATVGFKSAEFETGLGSQYFNIPIVTSGETTVYPIKVQIEVVEYTGDFAAKEDVDYIITSKEIYVASAESTPSVEVKVVNPNNADALIFKLKIASQENAQSISQGEVLVKCEKSDLDRVCGTYTVTGMYSDGSAANESWVVSNDGTKIQLVGMFNETQGYIEGTMKDGVITFPLGPGTNQMIGAYNFTGIGPAYVGPGLGSVDASGNVSTVKEPHELKMTVSEDFKSMTLQLEAAQVLILGVYSYDDVQSYLGWYDCLMLDSNTVSKK